MRRIPRRPFIAGLTVFVLLSIIIHFFLGTPPPADTRFGFTWSNPYARQLGLDPQAAFAQAVLELRPEHIRLPVYWSDVEKERGVYDFSEIDAQMEVVKATGIPVTIVVGSRVPRWPECWEPKWALELDQAERYEVQMAYTKAVYGHLRDHPSIVTWQVENEAFFDYYQYCHGLTRNLVLDEMHYVRSQEQQRPPERQRQVVTTDSGEWSLWAGFSGEVDGLGISVYRSIQTEWFGTLSHWYFTPMFYWRRAQIARWWAGEIFVSEFQMEPWVLKPIEDTTDEEQFKTFDLARMRSSFQYARKLGMSSVDFWGVEWWLWMKNERNHPEFWEEAKMFFESQK